MKCIFCKEEKSKDQFSDEHVFPKAIGGSFLIRNMVCRHCNSELGREVDSKLTDHFLVRLIRYKLGLVGKKGKMRMPFKRGELVGSPKDSQGAINVVFGNNRERNEPNLRILPKKFEPYVADDGVQWYKFVCDPEEVDRLISMVRSFLRTEGLPAISDEEILSHCQLVKADPNLVECWVEIDTFQYKRAIVKIAYELACEWLGRDYLNDPTGEKLRRFILDPSFTTPPKENAINGIVDFVRIPFQFGHSDEKSYSHIARIGYLEDGLACEINVLNVIRGRIIVTERRAAYQLFVPRRLDIERTTGTYRITLLQRVVSKPEDSLRSLSRGVGIFS